MQDTTTVVRALIEWADGEEAVRAVVLVGSRATPDAGAVDRFSDHDVLLFIRDVSVYEASDAWLEAFGSILVMLHERYELLGRTVPTRLVQYEDGDRIDFSLCDLEVLGRLTEMSRLPALLDAGHRVLLDKDGRLTRLPPATGSAYVPHRPTQAEYDAVVNEFWWEAIYVARHLARGELLAARYSSECVLRFVCLVPMLGWYVQAERGWSEPLGPHGRGIARLLDQRDRRRLERTFAGAGGAENWDALFATIRWFTDLARAVAGDVGLAERPELGTRVEAFLRGLRHGAPGAGSRGRGAAG